MMPPDLFAALAATWPAEETVRLGAFTLRRGGGNRTSAATLDGPLEDAAAAEAAMRAWGQRPLFRIRPGDAALDATLDRRGYRLHQPSVLYAAPSDALAAPAGLAAIPCAAPLACMAEIWAAEDVGPARLAVMGRTSAPRTWFLGRLEERPMGCAFVAVSGGVAMLSALVVVREARRRGLAGRMVRGAAAWAAAAGAGTFGLAVTQGNAPARTLYESLGMAEAARYHYRIAPEETP